MLNLIKRHLVVTVSLVLAITATAAAQAGVIPGVNEQNSQQPNVPTTQQLNGNGQEPASPQRPVEEVQPEEPGQAQDAPGDTTPTDEGGTPANNPTPVTPSEPVDNPTPPAPAPHQTGYTMRFVDVSPADKPNTKAAEYCDYHYSDGSTVPTWVTTITKPAGFGQPISSYSESNPPSAYAPC